MNNPASSLDLLSYDKYIVMLSGGKDSVASLLHLLDLGVDRSKVEIMHASIDGGAGEGGEGLMDWASTPAYVRAFGKALGIPVYFCWKQGGFLREMMRNQTETAPTMFETPDGLRTAGGNSGKFNTRLQFPQTSPDLSVRYCSGYLKVDPCATAIRNQTRFNQSRTLVITGERAAESASRANYKVFEADRADARNGKLGRVVDHFRPVHSWSEAEVWAIIERWNINPAAPYRLGWSRLSCKNCIFGSASQWRSAQVVDPESVNRIASLEKQFGKTIDRKMDVLTKAARGTAYAGTQNAALVAEANDANWNGPIFLTPGTWTLPAGAFGDCSGPV
jgi:Phosphoadenosine phosphosulfate reductase family